MLYIRSRGVAYKIEQMLKIGEDEYGFMFTLRCSLKSLVFHELRDGDDIKLMYVFEGIAKNTLLMQELRNIKVNGIQDLDEDSMIMISCKEFNSKVYSTKIKKKVWLR